MPVGPRERIIDPVSGGPGGLPRTDDGAARPSGRRRAWSRPSGLLAWVLVGGRWFVLLLWVAVALGALWRLPALSTGGGGLGDITSADNPALVVEGRSARDFGFPLLSRILVVQHDPQGLPDVAVRDAVAAAAGLDTGPQARLSAALPVPADERLPGVQRPGTTVVTLLYPRPDQGLSDALAGAREYAAQLDGPQDRLVGVTGTAAARAEQVKIVNSSLLRLEVASAAAVLLIVGIAFRSLVAPLITAAVAALAFVAVTRSAAFLANREGWNIPSDLEPLMVALMLGVVTDYVVYFLSGMRAELADGYGRVEAARRTTAIFAPIVVVAGLTVAAGVLTLLLATSPPVRAFGPAMALTVAVTLLVAVTVVPAVMAVLGPRCFWPSSPSRRRGVTVGGLLRRGTVRLVRRRIGALVVAAACVAGLLLAAEPIRELRAGLPFVASLPAENDVQRAARAAADGFSPGITSPTLVEVRAQDEPIAPESFERLQTLLAEQPHVAAVLGPREDDTVSELADRAPAVFVTADGTAARYLLMLDVDPLDAIAVDAVDGLEGRLPALLSQAGVPASAVHGLGGDTAAIAAVVGQNERDLTRILIAALLVNLLLLALFLRALVAPLVPAGLHGPVGGGHARSHGRALPGTARAPRRDLLRAARGRGAPGGARLGLQPLRRGARLGPGPSAAPAGRHARRTAAVLGRHHDRGSGPRREPRHPGPGAAAAVP